MAESVANMLHFATFTDKTIDGLHQKQQAELESLTLAKPYWYHTIDYYDWEKQHYLGVVRITSDEPTPFSALPRQTIGLVA